MFYLKSYWNILLLFLLSSESVVVKCSNISLKAELKRSIKGDVFAKGSINYEKRRLIHNGLCTKIYPDIIVVPESTNDVSAIVKITNKHKVAISIRSGGHSYTCQSTKQGGVHLDLRKMNRIGLASPNLAILGPGGTWADVLEKLLPSEYTMIHGQRTSVGVGGYILGGGVNVVGTSERYGSAAEHVERFTMVDAKGRILLVSKGNTSIVDPDSGQAIYQLQHDFGLFEAMGGAGSSYGIVTEFLYRIYPRPETQPVISMIYIETPKDLRRLEQAAQDGRFHVTWFLPYVFRDVSITGNPSTALGVKVLPKILKSMAMKRIEPIFTHLVDNSPNAGRYTNRRKARKFLKEYGIKLAKDRIFANVLPNMLQLTDYEEQYMTPAEIKKRGFQGIVSANLMGLSSQHILDDFIFNHTVFGLKNKESEFAKQAGCEFCYLVVPSSSRSPKNPIFKLTKTGKYQMDLTCMYPPNVGSRCPTVLKNIKEKFRRKAIKLGDSLTQYANTPSCDIKTKFQNRYIFETGFF